jgi:protein ImuB
MARYLSVWLPTFATDRWRRREARRAAAPANHAAGAAPAPAPAVTPPEVPVVLFHREHNRDAVARCCAFAAFAGVAPGMPLSEARALLPPAARVEPHRPDRDAAALEKLAVWAQRFSPRVAVDRCGDLMPGWGDGLMLDVTGVEHLFGGERGLVKACRRAFARLGYEARVCAASTPGAAWGVARFARAGGALMARVEPGGERAALGGLPAAALRIAPEVVEALDEVGVTTCAEVLALPRHDLPSRFGEDLLLRIDQALGAAIEPLTFVRAPEPLALERALAGPTDRPETIGLVVCGLLESLCRLLGPREEGVRHADLTLHRSDLPPVGVGLLLGRPSRDPAHLWTVLRPRLERVNLGFGVERVSLLARRTQRLAHRQRTLAPGADDGAAREEAMDRALGELADTLASRLGPDAVLRARLRETHAPEGVGVARPVVEDDLDPPTAAAAPALASADRPGVLLDPPEPAEVVALTPDGPVHALRWRGEERAVAVSVGPERIAMPWWCEGGRRGEWAGRTRDYFKVRSGDGRWVWVFRVWEDAPAEGSAAEPGPAGPRRPVRWFVHGVWA